MAAPELYSAGIEYKGVTPPITNPALYSIQIEYRGSPPPITNPSLFSAQIEYEGGRQTIANPSLYSIQLEYKEVPTSSYHASVYLSGQINRSYTGSVLTEGLDTGFVLNGVNTTILTLLDIQDVPVEYNISAVNILNYPEVNTNPLFDAENKWKTFVIQYIYRPTGELKNIIVRKPEFSWVGSIIFTEDAPTGTWDKRAMLIKAATGAELILLPTSFQPSEYLTLV